MKNGKLKPSRCPWGKIQSTQQIAPGITKYSTASHGGYHLTPDLNSKVPELLRKATFGGLGEKGWYEEDIDWAIVVYVFDEHFDEKIKLAAIECLKQFHTVTFNRIVQASS